MPRVEPVVEAGISPVTSIRHVLGVFALGMLLGLIFGARGLVHAAYGMPDGPERTITLAVAQPVLRVTQAVGLTRPWDVVEAALGHSTVTNTAPLLAAPAIRTHHPIPTTQQPAAAPKPRVHHLRPAVLPLISRRHPLRLLVTGDSLTEFMGPQLVDLAARHAPVLGNTDTHYGTGLVRPDFVDWSVVARQQVAQYHPQAVVVMMGGNDFQNMVVANGAILPASSPAWTREYQRRAEVVMRVWLAGGARRVYWLSMPPARSALWAHNIAQIDLALRRAVRQVGGGARYLNVLGPITNHGAYADFVLEHGQEVLIREPDGLHLNEAGSQLVTNQVWARLQHDWHLHRR